MVPGDNGMFEKNKKYKLETKRFQGAGERMFFFREAYLAVSREQIQANSDLKNFVFVYPVAKGTVL